MEPKPLYGNLTVYRGRGSYLHRLEQFDKAVYAYDEAFKTDPNDVQLLLGRSRVCAHAMKPQQAFADAEAALKLEPTNMSAHNVQADAMYTMCDFEKSLVMNHRGSKIRKQPPYFTEGIIQGMNTIQDCIGETTGNVMLDFLPLIKQQEASGPKVDEEMYIAPPHKSRIPNPVKEKKMSQLEKRKFDVLFRVLAMKYLGSMAYDKFFIQELSTDPRIVSANKTGSEELKSLIDEALASLIERQEMLRTQRPYYSIKLAESTQSKHLSDFKEQKLIKERTVGMENVERALRKIMSAVHENRMMDVMIEAERLQTFLDSRTPHTLPEKDSYVDRLYRYVGEGYLKMHRLSYRLSEASNRRRINFLMGLAVARPKSFDSVIANYPYKFVDVNFCIKKVEDTLEMCENSFMRCWLYYELARLSNSQKKYVLAKFYAKRCQAQAQEIGSVPWWLNGCFLLMAGEMQQANANDVRIAVEEALEWSKQLINYEQVQAFLTKCAEVAAETEPPDEIKAMKMRKAQILKVMDHASKVETKLLFKRISNLPPGRQFTVLPRKVALNAESERRKRKQGRLTVVPGAERILPPMPKSNVLGFQKFDF